jgi:excisionase family DNA binding protein
MSAIGLREETYLPSAERQMAQLHDFIEAHEKAGRGRPEPRYFLAGASPGDQVELPVEVYGVLRQVVEALRQGLAVTVAPRTLTLTTQQAADLLGISRPTVIRLLDEGRVPFERIGTHRRVLLKDVLAYRESRRAEQYAALEASSVSIDDEEDLEAMLRQMREARRVVARRRRGLTE